MEGLGSVVVHVIYGASRSQFRCEKKSEAILFLITCHKLGLCLYGNQPPPTSLVASFLAPPPTLFGPASFPSPFPFHHLSCPQPLVLGNEGQDHAVQRVEEEDQAVKKDGGWLMVPDVRRPGWVGGSLLEAELEEGLLLVLAQGPEDLCRVEHVVPVHDPGGDEEGVSQPVCRGDREWAGCLLVDVVSQEGSIEQEGDDLEAEQENDRHEGVRCHLG